MVLGLVLASAGPVLADAPLKSTNYEIDESVIGNGGLTQESSANFQAGENIGDTATGNTASSNFQVNAGYHTTGDPTLAFTITTASADFGQFSAAAAATATAGFTVSNYTSYGYAVQIIGNPPTNGSHSLSALASTTTSQVGTEQFGINLMANTSPISFGANPDNGNFGFGSATSNYGTANNYRYVSGESIAHAAKTSGLTIYTISYLVNVSSVTPGGSYSTQETLICTGTY